MQKRKTEKKTLNQMSQQPYLFRWKRIQTARGCRNVSVATVLFSFSPLLSTFCTHLPLPRLYSTTQPPIGCRLYAIGWFFCHFTKPVVILHFLLCSISGSWMENVILSQFTIPTIPPLLPDSLQIRCNLVTSASHMTITAVVNKIQ